VIEKAPGSAGTDWFEWHLPYDDPTTPLAQRLETVRELLVRALRTGPPCRRIVSICAGQGRDVIEGLVSMREAGHDISGISALLVERDARNVAHARAMAERAGVGSVHVVEADASMTDAYMGWAPAEVVVLCGVLGNISLGDIERTIAAMPRLCSTGGHVVWTRHRRPPDMTPFIRRCFSDSGFIEVDFRAPPAHLFTVGLQKLTAHAAPLRPGERLFRFVGDGSLPA
jgi:hypothetical protein